MAVWFKVELGSLFIVLAAYWLELHCDTFCHNIAKGNKKIVHFE
jgi:hypothetical protein